jgi:hypothetical protein
MSKRKNRSASSPNLPQSALERARQQIGKTESAVEEEVPVAPVEAKVEPVARPVAVPKPAPRPTRSTTPVTSRSASGSPRRRTTADTASKRRKDDHLDMDYIRNRLENPTRTVTEEQLRQDYSYVIRDLRSMAILAVALIAALVVLAQVLPK